MRAAALSAPVEAGEEDALEDDGEEEREVSIPQLEGWNVFCLEPYVYSGFCISAYFYLNELRVVIYYNI